MLFSQNSPMPEAQADPSARTMVASTKVSESEFRDLEQRALAAGKRLSTWIRDVLLEKISQDNLEELLLAELLGVRMLVLNLVGPLARGEEVSPEKYNKLVAAIDGLKRTRARELIAQRQTPPATESLADEEAKDAQSTMGTE